jgi:SOS response regulatory protein OraA/RecX
MTIDGNRYAADLVRLEAKRKELEDTLAALARDEDELDRVIELAHEIEQLEAEVHSARAIAQSGAKNMIKSAAKIRSEAEQNLDNYADLIREDGETHEQAYKRAMQTELGRSMIKTLDYTVALQTGEPTSDDVADAASR